MMKTRAHNNATAAASRLRAVAAHISQPNGAEPAPAAAAAAEVVLPEAGTGPGGQGFGPRSNTQPPHFDCEDIEGAKEFFDREGVSVLRHADTPARHERADWPQRAAPCTLTLLACTAPAAC